MNALQKLTYGIFIVSSIKDDKPNGQIANAVFQVAATPPLVVISIHKDNLTHDYIENSKLFTVSILDVDTSLQFIGNFGFRSGRDIDKFENVKTVQGKTGIPIVTDNSLAYLEAKVVSEHDAATHTLFVGEIINSDVLTDKEPLTYDLYHKIKKGKEPERAPTYVGS